MESSIGSVLKFLSKEGVSRASIKEMLADFSDAKYVAVMERAHQYAKCVAYRSQDQSTSVMNSALRLLKAAWEALAKYLALQYRQAHRHYHTLRRMGHIASVTESQVEKALNHKLDLAEQCCSSQKGLLLTQAWERRIRS
jgi:6-pyruvoyl-tetrahydropterin synthase